MSQSAMVQLDSRPIKYYIDRLSTTHQIMFAQTFPDVPDTQKPLDYDIHQLLTACLCDYIQMSVARQTPISRHYVETLVAEHFQLHETGFMIQMAESFEFIVAYLRPILDMVTQKLAHENLMVDAVRFYDPNIPYQTCLIFETAEEEDLPWRHHDPSNTGVYNRAYH